MTLTAEPSRMKYSERERERVCVRGEARVEREWDVNVIPLCVVSGRVYGGNLAAAAAP